MSLISKSLLITNKFSSTQTLIRSISSCHSRLGNIQKTNQTKNQIFSQVPRSVFTKLNYSTNHTNDVKKTIDSLVKNKPVVVFMKGTANQPMCGFSKAVVDILNMHGVKFETHNVLADEDIRSGVKEYSNWPTIPQIFFNGEFIGGCDILLEMHRSGELVEELKKIGINSKLAEEEGNSDKKL